MRLANPKFNRSQFSSFFPSTCKKHKFVSRVLLIFADWRPELKTDVFPCFSRMRSEGSHFTWGSGGEAVFVKSCVVTATVRKCRQPFAAVCVTAVRQSTAASASGAVPKACQVDSLPPQLYWRLQRQCQCERSVSRSYIGVCRGIACVCVCVSDLSPQLYWCLQRRCPREWSVSPQ